MALVSVPSKIQNVEYSAAPGMYQKWHTIQNRHQSVPKYSEPCPINSNRIEVRPMYRHPEAAAHTNIDALSNDVWSYGTWSDRFNTARYGSLNTAYDRFKESVNGQTASVGVNLAERKQAVNMIVDRATSLRLGYLDLRKGRFNDFRRRFRLGEVRREYRGRRWNRPKDASKLWLEYHFGWSPLIKDIHSAVQLLEAPFAYGKPCKGSASKTEVIKDSYNSGYSGIRGKFVAKTLMQATVNVNNPNLHRATQLGLTNPAVIAWELIPFSFLVDWFIPVENFLSSWSDFFGLDFEYSFTTSYNVFEGSMFRYMNTTNYGPDAIESGITAVTLARSLGITSPVIYPKAFKGLSVSRGATAISLLVTAFKT